MTSLSIEKENNSRAFSFYAGGLMAYAITCNFSISLSQTSLSIALIALIIMYRKGEVVLNEAPLTKAILFFAFAGFLSIFQAKEKFSAFMDMREYLTILVFYLAFWVKFKEDFYKKLLIAFIGTASLTSIYSLANVVWGKYLNNRAKGLFSLSITFGECQAIVTTTLITWLIVGKHSKKQFTLLLIALVLISASMITSMARGAWLGCLAGFLVLTIRFPRKLVPLSLAISLLLFPIIMYTPSLKTRLASFSISKNLESLKNTSLDGSFSSAAMASNYIRLNIWNRGFTIIQSCSGFGVGLNNVKKRYIELCTPYEKEHDFLIFGHQHNSFMQFYLMTGFLGLTAFLIFLATMIKFLLKHSKFDSSSWTKSMSTGAIAIFVCFLVTGLTEHSWGDEEVAMMAFFATGLMMNQVSFAQKEDRIASVVPDTN